MYVYHIHKSNMKNIKNITMYVYHIHKSNMMDCMKLHISGTGFYFLVELHFFVYNVGQQFHGNTMYKYFIYHQALGIGVEHLSRCYIVIITLIYVQIHLSNNTLL